MLTLSGQQSFAGFGRSRLISPRPSGSDVVRLEAQRTACRRLVRERCPKQPGVYGMVDAENRLIYVGKSKCLRARLLSYFDPGDEDTKARQIIRRTERLLWEPALHEFTALVRELELIRRWRPLFNVQGQPGRLRRAYVCLGRDPAPYLYLAGAPTGRTRTLFGPISAGQRTRAALRRLNDLFQLRDCPDHVPMHFADQRELFPFERSPACLRHEIGHCLAPCAARTTRGQYEQQVRLALSFLRGANRSPLERLEAEMVSAADSFAYERAAGLRDIVDDLAWLDEQLERLRQARREYTFVYPLESHGGRQVWHWIFRGQVAAITFGPRGTRGRDRCRRLAERIYQQRAATHHAALEDIGILLLVAGWFRKHPAELERIHRVENLPDLLA